MTPGSLRIPYQTEGFPAGTLSEGRFELYVTWDELLWAALTVGRPNRHYVFQHGTASGYEAVFRLSLIRMAVEQRGPYGHRLHRTNAAKTLDPTEKGMVNYFLGMSLCKLFAARCLNTPWMLHLDVFRPELDPVLATGSRPDLVGEEDGTGTWYAFECKGRLRPPGATEKQKAKEQAHSLVSVNGIPCSLHIGAITYFRGDVLHFYWCDPQPTEKTEVRVTATADHWRHYYEPALALVDTGEVLPESTAGPRRGAQVDGLDVHVGIHPKVRDFLVRGEWAAGRRAAIEGRSVLHEDGYAPDGISVKCGASWRERFGG